jgi:hypothetical protein
MKFKYGAGAALPGTRLRFPKTVTTAMYFAVRGKGKRCFSGLMILSFETSLDKKVVDTMLPKSRRSGH